MLRDTRTPIDATSICHSELSCLANDDHKQYALTTGVDRAELDVNNPQNGEILVYDSTSDVWYNTVNTGGSGTSGTSGSSGTSGTSPINPGIFIDATSGDLYYLDPIRSKNLGSAIVQQGFGRNHPTVTDQFLRIEGDVPSNLNGFVLPWNSTLIGISMSGELNTQTWTVEVRVNGGGVSQDSLTITNQYSNYSDNNNVDFNAGDRIMIYCSGTSISYPHATLFFRRRF